MPWHSARHQACHYRMCLQVAATPLFAAAAELYGRENGALRGVVAPEEVGEGGARGQQWGGLRGGSESVGPAASCRLSGAECVPALLS